MISRNAVGYSATPQVAENKFYIGNAPFGGVGADGTIKISQLVTTDAQPGGYDTMESQAPMIEVLKANGVGYDLYYYIEDADDGTERFDITGWADDGGNIADANEIVCGTAFWYKSVGGPSTLTMPGQVMNDASVTKSLNANKFALIGNPFPIALVPTKLSQTFPAGGYDTMESAAPMIEVLKANGVGYDLYYYIEDADDGTERFDITGWADDGGNIVTDPIVGVSQGFWIKLYDDAGDLTFAK